MRYLAIDYGLKRVGLALCDSSETIVSPLCQFEHDHKRPQIATDRVKQIVAEYQVQALVVGLPLNMDDTEGAQAVLTRRFAEALVCAVSLPLYMQDERLSSAAADELLNETEFTKGKKKQRRDMLAACDILRSFLNRDHV